MPAIDFVQRLSSIDLEYDHSNLDRLRAYLGYGLIHTRPLYESLALALLGIAR